MTSTSKVSPLSRWLNACTLPSSGETSTGSPPDSLDGLPGPGQLDLLDALGGDEEGDLALLAVSVVVLVSVVLVMVVSSRSDGMATAPGAAPRVDNVGPYPPGSRVCRAARRRRRLA